MYLLASFNYSLHTEIAITKLEDIGIKKEHILAVPLELRGEKPNIFDTIHHSDGISLFDGGAILGCICMVLGVIYGFVLAWGPIIWGLLGLGIGFFIGLILDLSFTKIKHTRARRSDKDGELMIMVHCEAREVEAVKKILWDHLALGIGVYQKKESAI